jgi:hypothetical protein
MWRDDALLLDILLAAGDAPVTLLDREIRALWDAPVHTAAMRHGM